ncbi:DUF5597 domain-containing protein [Chryseolinea lacunae]|uniref:DUF5597 domain-containing protein n=1 Tax=Chryseolinea lacunae TaxID=2801331 RepID=A0ABS1KMT8_9BACT|nr:DUF5597 domain-containing protein [Chryseolinea lacunae]MBL0740645.1 DUF5597 domain-containing protein [Chryseolinea lacunae]
MTKKLTMLSLVLMCALALSYGRELPKVVKRNGRYQLLVDGKPFLVLGAQLWNSSAWPVVTDKFWTQLRELNCNTLEAPVYWQNIEPEPGVYNFKELDNLILNARKEKLRLVLLWFASYKNGSSTYAPPWVLENPEKYPLMRNGYGDEIQVLSPVSRVNLDADKRAFTALMKHVKELDSEAQTVIMVQVENESGSLGTDRDYSEAANKLFDANVPDKLATGLGKQAGKWSDLFGIAAAETFNAWHIASYINEIADVGKAVYNLPMYANAWGREHLFHTPGEYPSGGPTTNMIGVWKIAAPQLDFLSPDIYISNPNVFLDLCEKYDRDDNMLFIPETANCVAYARFHFYAIGNYHAKGLAVYGVDPFHADPHDKRTFDKLDERFSDIANNYKLLAKVASPVLALQEQNKLRAVGEEDGLNEQLVRFDEFDVLFDFGYPSYKERGTRSGRALIGQLSANEFLIVGFDAKFRFRPKYGSGFSKADYVLVEEGYYEGDKWVRERLWNGDETYHSTLTPRGTVLKIRLRKVKASSQGPIRANFEQK